MSENMWLVLPFPVECDLSDESTLPEYLRDALPIAQKRIHGLDIQSSNAFIFSLENTEGVEKAFLRHLGAIAGFGFIEPISSIDMNSSWVCAVSDTEAIVVKRKNSWAL